MIAFGQVSSLAKYRELLAGGPLILELPTTPQTGEDGTTVIMHSIILCNLKITCSGWRQCHKLVEKKRPAEGAEGGSPAKKRRVGLQRAG